MLDPLSRWRRWTADGVQGAKEMHVGLPTFAALPYTEDAADLDGVDVAIVGAPYDNQIDHPGARYGPRAIRAAGHVGTAHPEVGIDPLETLRVVDYGDAPIIQLDGEFSSRVIRGTVGEVVEAGVIPLTLGGDHWITNPCIRAVAERHGPLGLVHFDAHNDTDPEYLGVTEDNHSTVFHSLVAGGLVDGGRYAQIGLRGYYAFAETIDWQREQGIRTHWMHDVRDRGIGAVIKDVIAQVGGGPAYVTVDVDVLDPAFAPGTGTLDPGGMTTLDLFWAAREVCRNLDVGGADVVEVAPLEPEGADITAFAGHYVAREFLNGIALRRASSGA
jgi:agmatinase